MVLLGWAPSAWGDDGVDRMLQLLRQRPEGMEVRTWQTQRREAVRELGRRRERRAVPLLLAIVDRERVDVILEFAITALGEIGDPRARPALHKLEADSSRDKFVREAAARALRKIGAGKGPRTTPLPRPKKPGRPRPKPRKDQLTPPPAFSPPSRPRRERRSDPGKAFGPLPTVEGQPDSDVIFRARWWDLAAGAADIRWDGEVEGTTAGLKLGSRYLIQEERRWLGFSVDAAGHLGFSLANAPGAESTWELTHSLQVTPEVRFYPFSESAPLLFGQITGGAGYGLVHASHPTLLDDRLSVAGSLSAGAGPGYGRVVDAGPRLRLVRVQRVLEEAGLLTGPIPVAVANQLIHAWYKLRNHQGSYARLGHTLSILHGAKLLRKPLNAAASYRLIRVLDDPQMEQRRDGFMVRLGYGYARTLVRNATDTNLAFLYTTGEYHRQLSARHAFSADLRFFYQHVGDPDFYGVTFSASYMRYLYTASLDPVGSWSGGIEGGVSNQPGAAFANSGVGYRFVAGGAYTHYFSRGTRVSASLGAGIDTGSPLVLFSLEARYGLTRGSYLGAAPSSSTH